MSGDENDMVGRKRKRKPGKVDSSASSSSTSSGSPFGSSSSNGRRRKVNVFRDSTESESSEESDVVVKRKKIGKVDSDSDFSSDNDSSPIIPRRRIFHAHLNLSQSDDSDESDSSVSDVIVPRRLGNSVPLLLSEQEDESDQWMIGDDGSDSEPHCRYDHHLKEAGKGQCDPTEPNTSVLTEEKNIDSDSSEGNSEKCPICLISFRLQEVGIPENCEHKFCLECIEEWSKNMNTCPVDRKEYNSITVRKCLNGKVLREMPIQRPERQEDPIIIEDPTFCEICGSSDDEDRLLLCDGCDLGFHLYCLNPPLDEVPEGVWYCNLCGPEVNHTIDFDEVAALMDDADELLEGIPFELLHARRTSRR